MSTSVLYVEQDEAQAMMESLGFDRREYITTKDEHSRKKRALKLFSHDAIPNNEGSLIAKSLGWHEKLSDVDSGDPEISQITCERWQPERSKPTGRLSNDARNSNCKPLFTHEFIVPRGLDPARDDRNGFIKPIRPLKGSRQKLSRGPKGGIDISVQPLESRVTRLPPVVDSKWAGTLLEIPEPQHKPVTLRAALPAKQQLPHQYTNPFLPKPSRPATQSASSAAVVSTADLSGRGTQTNKANGPGNLLITADLQNPFIMADNAALTGLEDPYSQLTLEESPSNSLAKTRPEVNTPDTTPEPITPKKSTFKTNLLTSTSCLISGEPGQEEMTSLQKPINYLSASKFSHTPIVNAYLEPIEQQSSEYAQALSSESAFWKTISDRRKRNPSNATHIPASNSGQWTAPVFQGRELKKSKWAN